MYIHTVYVGTIHYLAVLLRGNVHSYRVCGNLAVLLRGNVHSYSVCGNLLLPGRSPVR